jgi:hypothetical protein
MPRRALVIAVIGFGGAVSLTGAGAGGCSAPRDAPSLSSRDAHRKIPAIKHAVEKDDEDAVPHLVAGLESDDPAVRMYSIEGLERLTGQTRGFRYYADDDARRAAVRRWKRWLSGQHDAHRTITAGPTDHHGASRERGDVRDNDSGAAGAGGIE